MKWLKEKGSRLAIAAMLAATSVMSMAGASGESVTPEDAMGIINTATASLKSDSAKVIAAGLGIAVLFFGAKFLWKKFRSMTSG